MFEVRCHADAAFAQIETHEWENPTPQVKRAFTRRLHSFTTPLENLIGIILRRLFHPGGGEKPA